MTFRVIPPLTITTAMLTSSTVAEPDTGEAVWSSATTYGVDAVVINTTTHRKFQSLQASNTNKALPVWPETQNLWWIDIGPTNRWAIFDLLRNTATVSPSTITVVLQPGTRISSLALRGLVATSAYVEMKVSGQIVYARTENLNKREVGDWYDYFFADFATRPNVTLHDLPPYSGATVTVTISNTGGAVACGALVVGKAVELGEMLAEPESDVRNFSTIERDADGTAALKQRRNVPVLVSSILCDKANVNRVRTLRDTLNAAPAVWSGIASDSDEYAEAVDIFGIYTRFTINLKHQTKAVISLSLEEI